MVEKPEYIWKKRSHEVQEILGISKSRFHRLMRKSGMRQEMGDKHKFFYFNDQQIEKMRSIMRSSDILFRWTVGNQDTVSLSDYTSDRFRDMVWLAKLSIVSFQRWFPEASFLLLYNGYDYDGFRKLFDELTPKLLSDLSMIDQRNPHICPEKFENPYHFVPVNGGVWMKWVPFRFDITKTEIAVDTDIICISEPKSWSDYFDSDACILVASERYEKVLVNTCGDFHSHPLVKNKKPFNCGIVGQKAGHDYGKLFFDITRHVKYGQTHDSLFITEQGAVNVWVRALELKGVGFHCLDFKKNAWMRDFIYFMEKGVPVETVHAVAWHKKIAKALGPILERRIQDPVCDDKSFLGDILKEASRFDPVAYHLLARQLGSEQMSIEYLIPRSSF